ncbi:oxidoreductase [Rhodococcus qingshengii]|uniref:oxidoreductase n=1 Tax=Rhodococcus qingshengii TaxID=334542 RepID=UPI001BE9F187|nr:oxidoreductase [Rhodococcus qingshengii]MBT2273348.1 oxidoreductase [Rhodococcus qingshengii]
MPHIPDSFDAFVVDKADDGTVTRGRRRFEADDLGPGDVTIRVAWSGVNYKDALASTATGKVARQYPLVPGIDLAGEVVDGPAGLTPGTEVLVHGYDLGVAHHGGFGEYARVPADWIVPLPAGLDARTSMLLGTAGFTAALSVQLLEQRGLRPGTGPVLVTGASGGVGSVAVGILAGRGYEVVASSGKPEAATYLKGLGAAEVIDRAETSQQGSRPLERERWAGAVDCVGGDTLAYVLRTLRVGAAVAASGNTGGVQLSTSVFPFILRGAALLGVDSVRCPIEDRRALWQRLAGDLRPNGLDTLATRVVGLAELEPELDAILSGQKWGRTLVAVSES